MCSSNYPFKYELPHTYSHFISSAGGVPSAVSHLEGEFIFCGPCKATQLAVSCISLFLALLVPEHPEVSTVLQVVLW